MKNLINKDSSATLLGLLIAIIAGIELIDWTTLDLKRDWFKLTLCIAIAAKGYFVSFKEKSLNSKAKK